MSCRAWWQQPLDLLSDQQWEALCDGCGLCCLNKLEDIDTGEVYFSRVACKLLDIKKGTCSNYACRQKIVPDCLSLREMAREDFHWLPPSCAYRLCHEGKPLPAWHYLCCGDKQAVHRQLRSVRHFALSEADGYDIDEHLLWCLEDILGKGEQ